MRVDSYFQIKMATSSVVADAMCEDKIADLWPEYPCPVKLPKLFRIFNIQFANNIRASSLCLAS